MPVPGASAVLAALVGSGLPTDRFTFVGYPPRKDVARRRFLRQLVATPGTLVLLESPRRIAATLAAAAEILGNRQAALARELTKMHEECRRGSLAEIRAELEHDVRGEITLCIGSPHDGLGPAPDDDQLRRSYADKLGAGIERSAALRQLAAEPGLRRRDVYGALHLRAPEAVDEGAAHPTTNDEPDSGATE